MDEKRIKIAEKNFKRYLDEGLIRKTVFQDIVFQTYFKNSFESLKTAEELLQNKISSLWVIVSSYYSMFYIACAYLYKKGYKTKHEIVHQIVNESLIVLARHDLEKHFLEEYEEEREKAMASTENLLNDFEFEKTKRSQFQYETTGEIKYAKAKTSLERAKNFVAVIREIIGK